jgi:hypothetical protein
VHDLAAIVPEHVGDQSVYLDALRCGGRGLRDALFVDRRAPDQDVEPDVVLEANQVGLQQLRRLLLDSATASARISMSWSTFAGSILAR